MICPICGNDTLLRKGTNVICVHCRSEGTCDMVDTPVRDKDIVVTINLFDESNRYIGTKIHRGLEKVDYTDLSTDFVRR